MTHIKNNKEYNGSSIQVLEGLEAVRVRPGMYIGSTNTRGLHHLLWEVVDNAIDEHLSGYADQIKVNIQKDGSVNVEDNGRGIPVDIHPKQKIPTARVIFTVLHAGGKFNNSGYNISGGLHGVGASVVNALSEWMDVEIYREGKTYIDRFENGGKPVTTLTKEGLLPTKGKTNKTGTRVSFKPDESIFETVEWDEDIIKERLKEKAYLNPGITISFYNEKTNESRVFHEEEGIAGFIKELTEDSETLSSIISFEGRVNGIEAQVSMQYVSSTTETIISYCNNIPTHDGGSHVTGFKTGLTRLINNYVKELNFAKDTFDGKDIRSGLVAIVSLRHPNPQYEGQTKGKLSNTDAKSSMEEIISNDGRKMMDRHVMDLKEIVEHIKKVAKIRLKEDQLKVKLDSKEVKLQTNGKLAMCFSKDPKKNELFIVEGNSAGGTAKQGRDREFQSVLPLRGKVLNVEKSSMEKALKNQEIISLYAALGCGYGEEFNIEKLKYDKIIILTDADVDGSHIRILLMTLFRRFSPELLTQGHVYRGVPPLYKITFDKKATKNNPNFEYAYSDKELKKIQEDGRRTIKSIQRYKGLGEMDADQLWETTLDPHTRILEQITVDSMAETSKVTELLMGSKTEPRREFIVKNAHKANL